MPDFKNNTPYLTCKDHLVSGKEFGLVYSEEYDMLITEPRPDLKELPEYYKSEDYISHTDSKRTLADRIYRLVKNHMFGKKIKLINRYFPAKGKLLDIGTGTGDFLMAAKNSGWQVLGIEPNEKARKIASDKKVSLENNTGNLPDNDFDVITMWHVLEHVPDLDKQLSDLDRLLKENGVLIIAVPNFKSHDAKHYGSFWAAYDVPRHLWHFSKTSISKLFSQTGFEVVEILPLKFDSYYVSLLSEKHKTCLAGRQAGKTNVLYAFWVGFLSNWKARSTKEHSSLVYVLKRNELPYRD